MCHRPLYERRSRIARKNGYRGIHRLLEEIHPNVPPMRGAFKDLIRCIEQKRDPISSGEDGRATLMIGIAIHLSSRNGVVHTSTPVEGEGRKLRVILDRMTAKATKETQKLQSIKSGKERRNV